MDKIDWYCLSLNTNPDAIQLLEKKLDKIDWIWLSENPHAIPLLEKFKDIICWDWLSCNPNAIHLLKQNVDKIHLLSTIYNKNILELFTTIDYTALKERKKEFAEELVQVVFHPSRIVKQATAFGLSEIEYLEQI